MLSANDAKKLSNKSTLTALQKLIEDAANTGMEYVYLNPDPYCSFLLTNPKGKHALDELRNLGYKIYADENSILNTGIKISWE